MLSDGSFSDVFLGLLTSKILEIRENPAGWKVTSMKSGIMHKTN